MSRIDMIEEAKERTAVIKKYLENYGIVLLRKKGPRLPHGMIPKIVKETGYRIEDVRSSISKLKSEMPFDHRPESSVRFPPYFIKCDAKTVNKHAAVCLNDKLFRGASHQEVGACDTIIHALLSILPYGGFGIYMGTPALFCASPSQINNMFLDDNSQVYNMLKHTTDEYPLVVIGGAINEEKAKKKAIDFQRTQSSCHSPVMICYLDAFEFYNIIREACLEHKLVKVVFQASGVWSFSRETQKRYPNINLNFQESAHRLIREFPHLHILAMVREAQFGFDIRYLHNGKDIVLPRWKHPSLKKDK